MTGVIGVFKRPHISRLGFNIGSPSAPGGATLYAAMREMRFLRTLPIAVQNELRTSCWLGRWYDDLLFIWRSNLSDQARVALEEMMSQFFYGNSLELIPNYVEDVAFGFVIQVRRGRLLVQENLK